MLKYVISFVAGFVTAKVVTKPNIDRFKKAALKSCVVVKDEFSDKETAKGTSSETICSRFCNGQKLALLALLFKYRPF